MSSVKISEFSESLDLARDDYFPIVQSQSFTTYRTPIQVLITLTESGSASWAENSLSSSTAISTSHAFNVEYVSDVVTSSYVVTASYFDYISQQHVSYSLSCSWASSSISTSYAESASYWPGRWTQDFVFYSLSASYASQSSTTSYADVAYYVKSASYAATASIGLGGTTIVDNGVVWAWASFSGSSIDVLSLIPAQSFNVDSIKLTYEECYQNWCYANPALFKYGLAFHFTTPLPSNQYILWGIIHAHRWGKRGNVYYPEQLTASIRSSPLIGIPRVSRKQGPMYTASFYGSTCYVEVGANDSTKCTASIVYDHMNDLQLPNYADPTKWPKYSTSYPPKSGYIQEQYIRVYGTILVLGKM